MKISITEKDIYDISIADVDNGRAPSGCKEGFEFDDNDIDIDEVNCDEDDITIYISGNCSNYGYHNSIDCVFEGELTMNSSDFAVEYTDAAEYGRKFIEFTGEITIKLDLTSEATIEEIKFNTGEDEIDIYDIDDGMGSFKINAKVYLSDLDL